jgi:hypothetical protein
MVLIITLISSTSSREYSLDFTNDSKDTLVNKLGEYFKGECFESVCLKYNKLKFKNSYFLKKLIANEVGVIANDVSGKLEENESAKELAQEAQTEFSARVLEHLTRDRNKFSKLWRAVSNTPSNFSGIKAPTVDAAETPNSVEPSSVGSNNGRVRTTSHESVLGI